MRGGIAGFVKALQFRPALRWLTEMLWERSYPGLFSFVPAGVFNGKGARAIFNRGISSIATMNNTMPVAVMRSPCSRVWVAARRVTARMAVAGMTAPKKPMRRPMIVIERMAMISNTRAEEAKMAADFHRHLKVSDRQ